MSYYQYYEFQVMDRLLSETDMKTLRNVSSRAEITATGFATHYHYGDFKGDTKEFLERWFDIHLYLAVGGTRRLMIKLPARFAKRVTVERMIDRCDFAELADIGEYCLLDIFPYDDGVDYDESYDGPGLLDAMAPLRSELLSGDLRLPYLIWLAAADRDMFPDDVQEPLPGIGPLTEGLETFGMFFGIDSDLVRAAAETTAGADYGAVPPETALEAIRKIPDDEKTELLRRFLECDAVARTDLKSRVRPLETATSTRDARLRTLSELRTRAAGICDERRTARERAKAEERLRLQRQLEEERRKRLDRLRQKGGVAWSEVETEIAERSVKSYDRALQLVLDMHSLAEESGKLAEFFVKLDAIRLGHGEKKAFIRRLDANSSVLRRS